MPKIAYIDKRFQSGPAAIIELANGIIDDYEEQGFSLTLRQLYYQFIARDLFPDTWIDAEYNRKSGLDPSTKNTLKNYKRLASILNDARLAGLIDWNAIEDRTRYLRSVGISGTPEEEIRATAEYYNLDKWGDQETRIEVWIEKDALVGVIEGVCSRYQVGYYACRGYSSQSEQWRAGMRFAKYIRAGQSVLVLHLGDHDPSGVDMTRDNDDRLRMFAGADDDDLVIKRIALNIDQVRKYNPPPNPAKFTDSRAKGYIAEFGKKCWELDALEPKVIEKLIEKEIRAVRDETRWQDSLDKEAELQSQLTVIADHYSEIVKRYTDE